MSLGDDPDGSVAEDDAAGGEGLPPLGHLRPQVRDVVAAQQLERLLVRDSGGLDDHAEQLTSAVA